jgi:ABC-2 type transport system permease protein
MTSSASDGRLRRIRALVRKEMGIMVFMMPAMLLSGFASPVQNMPAWLQPITMLNPLTHFMVIMRGVFLRDMPFWLVAERIWPMAAIAVATITAAAWLFRRKIQ